MVWGNVAKWLFLVGSFLYSPPVLQNSFINRSSNSIQIGDSILNKSEENDFVSTKSFTPPIRGIYVPGWAILTKKRVDSWMNFLQENDLNTLVIDIKNARGELFFNSSVPLADSIDAQAKTVDGYIRSLPFGYLHQQADSFDVRLVARHVMFRDEKLYSSDSLKQLLQNGRWVDMRNNIVIQYNLDVLKEEAQLGFDEIVLDYIRFPDNHRFATREEKYNLIDSIVRQAKKVISPYDVDLGVFVYGCVSWHSGCSPIGQRISTLGLFVDRIYPMLYPSHFAKGEFGYSNPREYPYKIISSGYMFASKKTGVNADIIPMLQSFWYAPKDINSQLKAVYDYKMPGFIFWNPRGNYELLKEASALRSKKDDSL